MIKSKDAEHIWKWLSQGFSDNEKARRGQRWVWDSRVPETSYQGEITQKFLKNKCFIQEKIAASYLGKHKANEWDTWAPEPRVQAQWRRQHSLCLSKSLDSSLLPHPSCFQTSPLHPPNSHPTRNHRYIRREDSYFRYLRYLTCNKDKFYLKYFWLKLQKRGLKQRLTSTEKKVIWMKWKMLSLALAWVFTQP